MYQVPPTVYPNGFRPTNFAAYRADLPSLKMPSKEVRGIVYLASWALCFLSEWWLSAADRSNIFRALAQPTSEASSLFLPLLVSKDWDLTEPQTVRRNGQVT